jgi:tetratricopeptide (TPR) repeat protein
MAKHWFISYARNDGEDFARRLHDQLERDGFNIWLDREDIRPSTHWDSSIDQALRDAAGVLFVMTSGSVTSEMCSDEWSRALSYKLPVIPLHLDDAEPPLRLARRQWIDFLDGAGHTISFERGIAALREHLRWVQSPAGELQTLRDRLADYKRDLERDPANPRFQKAVSEMEEQIAFKERALAEPEAVQAEYRQSVRVGIAAEIERDAQQRRHAREMARQRIVGSAPQGVSEFFKDRVREAANIHNALLGDVVRAASVYGKGGVGKTALVCKILEDLEKDYDHVYGIIYTSARPGLDIDLEQIYLSSAAMFGGEVGKALNDAWINPKTDAAAKIRTLLNAYANAIPDGQRVVILLDNLEEKLDAQGHLIDPDLRQFVDMALETRHHARLVITSREPLNPANSARRYERIFSLDEGLPEPDALELLADFDPDGRIGLRDADPAVLREVVRRTMGFPRALEAVAGILNSDPTINLPDLLADRELWASEVTEALVRAAQSRLDADAELVMQALALYGEPVTEAAVGFLLEPFVEERGLDLHETIQRLARGRYLTVQRATGELVLHPLDKEANYRRIPRDTTIVIHIIVLETRAADYFSERRGDPENWKTIDDLHPILAEFEHRVKAEDYETAALLIGLVDFDYLLLWGHAKKIVELREMLRGKLSDRKLEGTNFNMLGHAYSNLGDYRQALACYETELQIARELENRWNEGTALGGLGSTYWSLGQYGQAIEYQEQALTINREVGNLVCEGFNLNELALNYAALGQRRKAIEYYEQSLHIAREIDDRRGQPATLVNLGDSYRSLGQIDRAQEHYRQALAIDREIGDYPSESSDLCKLGFSHFLQEQYSVALDYFRQGLDIAREVGNRRWESYHLACTGDSALALRDAPAALEFYRQAVTIADELASPELSAFCYRGTSDILVYMGDLLGALNAITTARQQERPRDRVFNAALRGTILARLGEGEAARAAFQDALAYADELLADTAELYGPKYTRGRALAGLALLCDDPSARWEQAAEAYRAGRANCDAAGVLAIERRWLDYLAPLDGEGRLEALRAILR